PEELKTVLILIYKQGFSFREAGCIMNKSKDRVQRLRDRALEKLRDDLGLQGFELVYQG
ncbi:hypothetical protein C2W62_47710, partial [Candidatus Entotheonella serta]